MECFRSEYKLYSNKVSNSLWLGRGGKSCWMKVYIIPSTAVISFILKISLLIYLLKCTDIFVVVVSCSVMFDSLRPQGLQHARLPCLSPSPEACSN